MCKQDNYSYGPRVLVVFINPYYLASNYLAVHGLLNANIFHIFIIIAVEFITWDLICVQCIIIKIRHENKIHLFALLFVPVS